jgi:hypothetical protein
MASAVDAAVDATVTATVTATVEAIVAAAGCRDRGRRDLFRRHVRPFQAWDQRIVLLLRADSSRRRVTAATEPAP